MVTAILLSLWRNRHELCTYPSLRPEALPRLEELTEELALPLNVTLHWMRHGHPEHAGLPGH
ncbi:MAG: hypothetical protein ACLUNQ_09650 [Oscillospiraceae bacterium]